MENKKNIRCFFKKIAEILGIVYVTAISGFSLICIVFACFGYNFSLYNYKLFAVVITLLAVAEVVMVFVAGRKSFSKKYRVLFLINAFLMCVNIAVWVFKSESVIVAFCLFMNIPCALVLGIITARSRAAKLACSIGAGVPIVIVGVIAQLMPFALNAADQLRIGLSVHAHRKKGGRNPLLL